MTDLRERPDESRYSEALIEKVAEAIRQSAVMKMEEGEDLALYVAEIWRTYARAALATIEAEQQAEVGALVEEVRGMLANFKGFLCPWCEEPEGGSHLTGCSILAVQEAVEPFERTLGSQ